MMKKLRIIFVDNDEDEQQFMKEGFDATGLFDIIHQAREGHELFELLENETLLPDIILSDLNMPGKNGYEILEGIANDPRYKSIPVIITSTSSTKTIIDKCKGLGAAEYLVKPETFTEYVPFAKKLYDIIIRKGIAPSNK